MILHDYRHLPPHLEHWHRAQRAASRARAVLGAAVLVGFAMLCAFLVAVNAPMWVRL